MENYHAKTPRIHNMHNMIIFRVVRSKISQPPLVHPHTGSVAPYFHGRITIKKRPGTTGTESEFRYSPTDHAGSPLIIIPTGRITGALVAVIVCIV